MGAAAREQRAAALDAWLAALPGEAAARHGRPGRRSAGSVAGSARRTATSISSCSTVECPDVGTIAEKIWYPIWDAGLTLDHSVRTLDEALAVAREDTKAGLGLLDARHVAGDPELTARLRDAALAGSGARAPATTCPCCASSPPSAGARRESWPSCWTATSRRPAAGCATCGCCAASATPRSPTRGGHRCGRPTPACSTCATPCTSSPAVGATGCSPRTWTRWRPARRRRRGQRRGSAAPAGRRRRAHDRVRGGRRAARGRALARHAAPRHPAGGPRRAGAGRPGCGGAGRRGGAGPRRDHPVRRPQPVPAGGRRGRPARPAHLARHAGVAGPALPAAAAPVAGRRPVARSPSCSAPGRRSCRPGRRATGSAWSARGCRSGPGSAAPRSTTRCTGTPSTGT